MRCIEGIRKLGQRGTHKWVRADGAQSQLLGGGYRPSGGADAVLAYQAKKATDLPTLGADEDHRGERRPHKPARPEPMFREWGPAAQVQLVYP